LKGGDKVSKMSHIVGAARADRIRVYVTVPGSSEMNSHKI